MRHAYWIGILTGIAIALSALFAEPQRTEPQPATGDAQVEAYPAPLPPPLPPSAEGYPGPVDPYPYPAPVETWPTALPGGPGLVPTEVELPTPAPTMTAVQ